MPVKDIEVVFVQFVQQIEDSLDSEELSSRVQHEASVGIEIKGHGSGLADRTALEDGERSRKC